MTALADRHLAWAEKFYQVKGGQPFTIEGREWVRDRFFAPAFGWRLWPKNPARLCETCRARVDPEVFVDWAPALVRSLVMHRRRAKTCDGLRLIPCMVTVENLVRGDGKTTNMFALASAALADPELAPLTIQFMASAGSQTGTLIDENLLDPIAADRVLRKKFSTKGNKVVFDHGKRAKSYLEFVETSFRSNTGRRRGVILIDEARDVQARAVASVLPSIRATSKFFCPRGHSERPFEPDKVFQCPTCAEDMLPFVPRIWMVSSSGLDEGEDQWFNQLVELRQELPVPYLYLHRSEAAQNPNVAQHEQDVLEEAFADVPALKDYLAVELGNVPARKGDAFVTKADLRAVTDETIKNLVGSPLDCVGFLDTSWSGDLTSLLLAGWDPDECDHPWQRLRVLHWAVWKPETLSGGVIDPSAIQEHFDHHLPLFPALKMLLVDDRGMHWAKDFVYWNNRERARTYGRKVKAFHGKRERRADGSVVKRGERIPGLWGGEEDRIRGWQLLEQRIAATGQGVEALAIPTSTELPELHAELLGVVRKLMSDGSYQITDRSRKKRHADVAEALAGCCLLAYVEQTRSTAQSLSDVQRSRAASAFKDVFGGGRRLTGSLIDDMF